MSTPQEAVIDRLVEAYNSGDADRFLACFAEDARMYRDDGVPACDGLEAFRAFYQPQFDAGSKTEVVGRVSVGRHVADRARVSAAGEAPAYYLTIYTLDNERVVRVDFLGAEAQAKA
jgi:uncharacterized protein (TIGR02246 family)